MWILCCDMHPCIDWYKMLFWLILSIFIICINTFLNISFVAYIWNHHYKANFYRQYFSQTKTFWKLILESFIVCFTIFRQILFLREGFINVIQVDLSIEIAIIFILGHNFKVSFLKSRIFVWKFLEWLIHIDRMYIAN